MDAKALHILVEVEGATEYHLTVPAEMIPELHDLDPNWVSGGEIDCIIESARDMKPRNLIDRTTGKRRLKVWLK